MRSLAKIGQYDWVVFTSVNGVSVFFDAIQSLGKDARVFGSAKIAAIGSRTAESLGWFGIKADFVPDVFTGKELGNQLVGFANLRDKKILMLRSELASSELVEILSEAGAQVDNVETYTAVAAKSNPAGLTDEIRDGSVDWLTFASPSSVNGFFEQINGEMVNSSNVRVASVGPVTSKRLVELGIKVDVTAKEHTLDGLLDAVEEAEDIN